MSLLCSIPNLTNVDWAAWVQALGSIAAIAGAVWIAAYQTNKQQRLTMAALAEERRLEHLRSAEALHVLAVNSLKLQNHMMSKLKDREAVHKAGSDGLPFDMPMLHSLERSLDRIELHLLPASLISLSMTLIEHVRQFRIKVAMALDNQRNMDGDQFADFFRTLDKMNKALRATVEDFRAALEAIIKAKSLVIAMPLLKGNVMDSEQGMALAKHEKNIDVLFGNESLIITVLQALTGGAMFAAFAGSEKLIDIIGPTPFLVFLTTMDVALVLSILTAFWKHEYKKWDVKAAASTFGNNPEEVAVRQRLTSKFLNRMRRGMACAVWIAVIGFVELPVFAWLSVLCRA